MFLYDLELALAGWSRLSAFSFLSIITSLFQGATPDSRSEKADWSGHIDGVSTCTVPLRPEKKPPSLSRLSISFMSHMPSPLQHLGLLSPTLTDPEVYPVSH